MYCFYPFTVEEQDSWNEKEAFVSFDSASVLIGYDFAFIGGHLFSSNSRRATLTQAV